MRKLFEYKKYLQLISMSSKSYLEANWDKRNKVILEKVIIKAIRYGLHNNTKDKIDIKDNNYHLVINERFNEYLDTIEHSDMCRRETYKRARDKLKNSSGSNDDSHSSSRII